MSPAAFIPLLEQTGMIIDEFAQHIYTPGQPSWVDADRDNYDFTRENYSCAASGNPSTVTTTHPYNQTMWLDNLRTLAGLGQQLGVDNIIGIDIFNEPHDYTWQQWKTLSEAAYQAINEVNPNTLVFVQGIGTVAGTQDGTPNTTTPVPHGAADSNPNWGENLFEAGTTALTIPKERLVFSPHTYGPSVFVQSMFMDPAQPQCAGLEGAEDVGFVGVHGEDEDTDIRKVLDGLAGRLDAIEVGHRNVHDQNVRQLLLHQLERLATVGGFADHGAIGQLPVTREERKGLLQRTYAQLGPPPLAGERLADVIGDALEHLHHVGRILGRKPRRAPVGLLTPSRPRAAPHRPVGGGPDPGARTPDFRGRRRPYLSSRATRVPREMPSTLASTIVTAISAATRAGRSAALVMGGVLVMLLAAGLLEGFGRQLITADAVRYAIGLAMLAFWLAYFYLPRRSHI